MMAQEVTRREVSARLIETPLNLPIRLDRLMAFIGYYQDNHQGATPTVEAMANEMGTTHQTIRYWLGLLEADGRVRRISQNPLRLMLKEGVKPIEAARRFDEGAQGKGHGWAPQIADLPKKKQERFDGAEGRRLKLARFVGDYWCRHGHSPSLIQMMDAMNSTSGAIVGAMLDALEHRGLIVRPNRDRRFQVQLTKNGMTVLGLKKKEEVAMEPQKKEEETKTYRNREIFDRARKLRMGEAKEKRDRVYAWLADYQRRHGRLPFLAEIAEEFEYKTGEGARQAILGLAQEGKFQLGSGGGYSGGRLLGVDLPAPQRDRVIVVRGEGGQTHARHTRSTVIFSHVEQAKLAAKVMAEHYERWQEWPLRKEVSAAMGYRTSAGARRALMWMKERGYAEVRSNPGTVDLWALTDLGRDKLLDKQPEPKQEPKKEEEVRPHGNTDLPPRPNGDRFTTSPNAERNIDERIIERLAAENQSLKERLAEALTASAPVVAKEMSTADMVLALIEAGYDVRRR